MKRMLLTKQRWEASTKEISLRGEVPALTSTKSTEIKGGRK